MKYMKVKEKYGTMNLQIFAGEGGDDPGDGDDHEDDQDEDSDDDQEEHGEDEKKFSQKDVDAAVEKRLARERRKWNKQQQKNKDGEGSGKDGKEESEDSKARKAAEKRAEKAEAKNACYEAGVAKESAAEVVAIARSYMENDEDLDLEEAIEKVLTKYPHFKNKTSNSDDEEEETKKQNKSWGQRQTGKNGKKLSGVEKAFYAINPDLKE